MNNKGRCPSCNSNNTVLDKVPGTESLYTFICDDCYHCHDTYFCEEQGEK